MFSVKRKITIVILAITVFTLFLIPSVHARHITYVLITVDAEGPSPELRDNLPASRKSLLTEQVHAKANGVCCGISRMMDIADRYGDRISFFLDATEARILGEKTMEKIAKYIMKRGHDVQLHVDSLYLCDPERSYFYQYTLEEQIRILKEEKKWLRDWTGKQPVAFRAGAYAANADTLKALKAVNIPVDSSLFYGNSRCRINDLYSTKNMVVDRYGILQIPVTVFEKCEYAEIAGRRLKPVSRYKKVDIDSCDAEEIITAIKESAKHDLDTVILFLHSHSFIKSWDKDAENRTADVKDISEFDQVLEFIKKRDDVDVISVAKFYQRVMDGSIVLSRNEFVPKVSARISGFNYLRRLMGINRGNVGQWATGLVLVLFILAFFSFRFIRKRTKS